MPTRLRRTRPMTLFAGAVQLRPGAEVPARLADVMADRLSRVREDRPEILRRAGCVLAHLDLGLLDGPSRLVADERISLLAGEPLVALSALHGDMVTESTQALRSARGAFSMAHVDLSARRVWLVADKLALRPLYYAVCDDLLLFATTLRMMLELAPSLRDEPDLTAQTQLAALGQTLGSRSPYQRIRAVEAGEHLCIDQSGVRTDSYFSWDHVASVERSAEDFGQRLFEAFEDAVHVRLGTQERVLAQLSGGLDSRCIAAVLRAR